VKLGLERDRKISHGEHHGLLHGKGQGAGGAGDHFRLDHLWLVFC
jgi:hypothetical protein